MDENSKIEIIYSEQNELNGIASIDGQMESEVIPGDRIIIEKSSTPLKLIQPNSYSFFKVLRQKTKLEPATIALMLKSLHIQNFAIIEKLELDFFNGLSVLTGETGAGKSIIIDAIGLVLGDRADNNLIRAGKETAEIILIIDIQSGSDSEKWLRSHDFEIESECILRRIVRKDGKSRAYLNNVPVPLKTLKEFGERNY